MNDVCSRCNKEAVLCSTFKVRREVLPCCSACAQELAAKREYMKRWKAQNAEKNRAWSKQWAANNREKVNEYSREYAKGAWREWHNEYRRGRKDERAKAARKYRASNLEKVRVSRRDYYARNRERLRKYQSAYIKANPGFNRAASARHRALIFQRTVKWADLSAIKEFYKNCPPGMVVDHVIPLRGENVCGLHVLNNLQYLAAAENGKKSNKLMADAS